MLFALTCIDRPDTAEIRAANRPAHLEYLNTAGNVMLAGPFIENDAAVGSLVVIDVPDRAAAEAFAAADPYARAGLFERVTIREWRKVIG